MQQQSLAPPSVSSSGLLVATAKRQTVRLAVLMIALNILIPFGLFLYADISGKPYWRMFRGEYHAVDWFSSIQLLVIAWIAYTNFKITGMLQHRNYPGQFRHRWVWLLFAMGFFIFALDERFDIHEMLRDTLFRPAGFFIDVPWLIKGDVGLYLFFIIGLGFSLFLLDDMRRNRLALLLFGSALLLTLPTILIDSMNYSAIRTWPFWRFWDYTFEEVGEIWAQLLFLASFLVILNKRLETFD